MIFTNCPLPYPHHDAYFLSKAEVSRKIEDIHFRASLYKEQILNTLQAMHSSEQTRSNLEELHWIRTRLYSLENDLEPLSEVSKLNYQSMKK